MVGRVVGLGAIRAPRLTYSRCRFKNLGAFAPFKGEPCILSGLAEIYIYKPGKSDVAHAVNSST